MTRSLVDTATSMDGFIVVAHDPLALLLTVHPDADGLFRRTHLRERATAASADPASMGW